MPFQANEAKEKAKACWNSPKLVITYLWFTILVFAFMYALGAIVMAVNNNGSSTYDNKSLGFAGIWMTVLVILLSVGGTMVMRKYQTPLAVGFLMGVVIMMCFNMFSMSVLFFGAGYLARQDKTGRSAVHSDEAVAVFALFMSVLYGAFTAVLVKHRNIIIKEHLDISNGTGGDVSASSKMAASASKGITLDSVKINDTDSSKQNPPPVSV